MKDLSGSFRLNLGFGFAAGAGCAAWAVVEVGCGWLTASGSDEASETSSDVDDEESELEPEFSEFELAGSEEDGGEEYDSGCD